MLNKRLLVATGLAVAFLAGTPADAWRHRMRSTLTAEKNAERHRREIQHSFAVPTPNEGSTWLCAAMNRNLKDELRNKGNIEVVFEINRFGGSFENEPETEEESVRATIRGNKFLACAKTNKPLDRNDVIIATYSFNKAPRMRSDEEEAFVRVFTAISSTKMDEDDFFPPPPPEPEPPDETGGGGGGTGGSGGDGGSGGGSGGGGPNNTANNQRAAQILRGCAGGGVGIQFQWDKGRQKVDRRDARGNIVTIGPFASYLDAALAADSRWNCGAGNSVSADDGTQMNRLLTWGGVSGRRLALRFESPGGSGVYVDAYSPGTGAIHGSRFSTIGAAIRNFCGRSNISC